MVRLTPVSTTAEHSPPSTQYAPARVFLITLADDALYRSLAQFRLLEVMAPEPAAACYPIDIDAFVAELRPALVTFFRRRCGNQAEAEDLAQETIARALAHSGWKSADRARGYIFRIGVNLWRDRHRRRVARGITLDVDDPAHPIAEERSPERVVGGEEELRCIVAALAELNERTRDVFVLHRLEQMKQAEIATLLGISVSSVEKHIARALDHIGDRLYREAPP